MTEQELTDAQIETQDVLQQGIFNLVCNILAHQGLPEPDWDMAWIGELSEDVVDTVTRITTLTEQDIYPYIVDEGSL